MRNRLVPAASLFAFLLAGQSHAGQPGLGLALGGMFLTNSSQQGGSGPSGTTLLTQTDFFYNWTWFGVGVLFQYDKQGSDETDITFGPKLELHWGVFYLEGAYAPLMQQAFTDRSISKQTGSAWLYGVGVRISLSGSSGGSGGGGGFFFQAAYKYRTQTITQQDGNPISQNIVQSDGYPLFGVGYHF